MGSLMELLSIANKENRSYTGISGFWISSSRKLFANYIEWGY